MELDEISLKVIELVNRNPCLYDPKDRSFKDRTKKKEVWQKIAEDLQLPSIEVNTRWQSLRRQYITRRGKNLPPDTRFDKLMSFMEGCYGSEQSKNRPVEKPQLPASAAADGMELFNTGPSSSTATTTKSTFSSTSQDDPSLHWLSLLFGELSLKARQFPINKQFDIAKQVMKICEEITEEPTEIE